MTGATRVNVEFYLGNCYVALEDNNRAASLTLTYAFDHDCAGVIENYAGKVAEDWLNYKQIFK